MDFSQMFMPVRRVEAIDPEALLRNQQWPFGLPVVRQLLHEGLEFGQVTVIVGENGTGKSTLVEALAMAYGMNAEGGSTGAMNATRPSESELWHQLKLERGAAASRKGFFLRAETMHNFYTYLEESRFQSRLHERSHGESFLDLVEERIPFIQGLWILDEPESALSLAGCIKLLKLLRTIADGGSQIIISTHSPMLATFPEAQILEVGAWGLRESQFEHLQLVRQWQEFFDNPHGYWLRDSD
ncbi:AAA family ATPase [Arthrobacter sp. NIO-1057]|uniref:AAA family ATPase n=1 Tax=Arthrobacter sp. NIO-1057 TaxID=993071 RepID=UPI001E5970A1|nr:AAA family ATPase [Arthrobacter sp. NIO-1057]